MSSKPCCSHFEKRPVAIVGIAADLPSGTHSEHNLDYRDFFNFLLNKNEAHEEIPKERPYVESSTTKAYEQLSAMRGTFLKDIDSFDHVEFGISAEEARGMALSTKKLLEASFLALLDAGIDYRGRNVGWYASGTAHDVFSISDTDEQEPRGAFASIPCICDEISRHLDLRGPCVPIDASCNSSLTALHLAVQALRAGECGAAVVAGCRLHPRMTDFLQRSPGPFAIPGTRDKIFEAESEEFALGEGTVAIVLKPYDDAIRDGDYIYGNILGTGINASGSAFDGEDHISVRVDAVRRAYDGIDCQPQDVDYVERHGTGTASGHPNETDWIGQVFGRDSELLIGSVAGNIGHLGNAAFLASLCKVCAILEGGVVPPTLNLANRDPAVQWENYKLRVPREPTSIKARSPSGKLTISMSSSGIGGTNGHVVVQSASAQGADPMDVQATHHPTLLMAGGLTSRSAGAIAGALNKLAASHPDQSAAFSTISGRCTRQMAWRTFTVTHPEKQASPRFLTPVLSARVKPPVVFVFPGQGPQHINMGRQLAKRFPIFYNTIAELDECHRNVTGGSLVEQVGLFSDSVTAQALPPVWSVSVIFPSMVMVQIALFELLRSLGLRPNVLVGHSAGETSLLYASGAGPKAMAMEIAITQGRAVAAVEQANGAMAALGCNAADGRAIIHLACSAEERGTLDLAGFNAPDAIAISGHAHLVDKAVAIAASRGIFARRLQTGVAVHSALMELCQDEYRTQLANVFARYPGDHNPVITTYSTATGTLLERFTPDYFWRNFRDPVQFTQAFTSIVQAYPNAAHVEISPHPVLSPYMQQMGAPTVTCPMRRCRQPDAYQEETDLLTCLGHLVVAGNNDINFHALNGQNGITRTIAFPRYPFAKGLDASLPPSPPESPRDELKGVIMQSLNVDPGQFRDDAPLTSYGLDSLSAGRLAFTLRPFLTISSMELLGSISLTDIQHRIDVEKRVQTEGSPKVSSKVTYFQWDGVHKPGQTVLRLVDNGETPLIVIHGASGSPLPFVAIQEKFNSSLWALQTTPETPLYPLEAFCRHYYEQIKLAQPEGPYRLGAFCASTIMATMIAKMMEDNGDQVAQLCYIDHSPLLWVSPLIAPDEQAMELRSAGPDMIRRLLASMLALYRADPSPSRHRAAQDWQDAADGLEAPEHVKGWWNTFTNLHVGVYEFIFSLLPEGQQPTIPALQEALLQWMRSVKAPMTVFVALKGYIAFIAEERRAGWEQYGIERVSPDAQIITVTGGHFQVLESPEFIETAQAGWTA
ncbi:hypothetical protein WOLCODRAFT_161855 [Wolfiporia cocos MD-104 SS10]|uniref:Ketosynthase family 3 (KS3) domain-containing protein n=1 Tax=Wolfiporia cocos (strain MD-104) TaxID=742152 RepID=A0A2H3JIQ0_WOLCO|nr:hypothetical protein WOLCODRAFT_161855 [Wolfiporia cocos MD-104 SS10]